MRAAGGFLTVWLLGGTALASPVYTPNFTLQPGKTGSTGSPLVTADWTSNWATGGDYFTADSGAYDVVIGPGANLYALDNNSTSATTGPSVISLNGGSLTNYGILNTYPNTYPDFASNGYFNTTQAAVSVAGSNTTITNYGVIGFQPQDAEMDYEAVYMSGATNVTVNNYGAMIGLHGVYGNGSNTWVNNYAGGKIIAWFGTPIEFPNGRNFQYGGLINDVINGSYCFHPGYQTTVYNWGYCIASANGFWLDQHTVYGYDYGGPLVPASHDLDGNLVFNGNLTGDYEYNSINAAPGTSCVGFPGSTPIIAENDAVATLANTVYTVAGTDAIVNYLPLTFGYQMVNSGNRSGNLVLNFSHLTAAQQQGLTNTVANGWVSFTDSAGNVFPHVNTGSYTLYGHPYSWCTFGAVTLNFTDTITGTGIGGLPLPGIHYKAKGKKAYFTDRGNTSNPYYQTNAATVQLTGAIAEPAGQLTISPGWTLQLGTSAKILQNNAPVANPLNDAFSAAAAPANSINLESAEASTTDNVNGTNGQTTKLYGALVIDNPSTNVVLPNLKGGGWLVQSGAATTTLAGSNNSFSGTIYLANGTLALTPATHFKTAPVVLIGTNDASYINTPVLDISAIGSGASFTLGELSTPGYQLQVYPTNYSSGLQWPVIRLGNNTLVVGDGRKANGIFQGGLTGTGGLVVAGGTTLTIGPIAPSNVSGNPAKLSAISTFSGGISVQAGGGLMVQSIGGLGTGRLTNAGTLALASGITYATQYHGAGVPYADAAANHTLTAPADFGQAGTGVLKLRVAAADPAGNAGAGAGSAYDTVNVTGTAALDGTLALDFVNATKPKTGDTLTVLTAAGVTGAFAKITLTGVSGIAATQAVGATSVVVTFAKG